MISRSPKVSFELFPPKTAEGLEHLKTTVATLKQAKPKYFSVTYGAGGSSQNPTYDVVKMLKENLEVEVVPHLTCIGATAQQIKSIIESYQTLGIRQLVVLRGDLPSGHASFGDDFRYASDLVAFIRQEFDTPFTLKVGAYPECHPQAKHLAQDVDHFKIKVAAGADAAVTQYFYNADAYCYFVEYCGKRGIDLPIIPGIMPITNLEQLARFSKLCGAEIPQWIVRRLESFGDDLAAVKAFGIEVVTRLCERLLAYGAPELHFYTLNKAEPTLTILNNLSLTGGEHVNNTQA